MCCVIVLQRRQKDDQKPLEEKIKALKKRNAELAAIARRLEEKARSLQQENIKVALLVLTACNTGGLNWGGGDREWVL